MKETAFLSKIPLPLIIVFTWIALGMLLFHSLEDWTWVQCFYYSVITLTTVGYGDFTPTTDLSRFFAAWYILIGVTIALGALGYIGSTYIQQKEQNHWSRRNRKKDE